MKSILTRILADSCVTMICDGSSILEDTMKRNVAHVNCYQSSPPPLHNVQHVMGTLEEHPFGMSGFFVDPPLLFMAPPPE